MEEWRDIEGYEGLYQISSLGRVKSFPRPTTPGGILKINKRKDGYCSVMLCKNGKTKRFLVHRLVAKAFIPNPNNLPMINHKNENPSKNIVDNLEWCDNKYNCNYGTLPKRKSEIAKTYKINRDNLGRFYKGDD